MVDEVREVGEFNRIVLNMEALVVVKDSLVHSCVVKAQEIFKKPSLPEWMEILW
ncbi:MAG: hypothetical protein IPG39_15370 [Bacteroidetes bacterium]|nr:hypothetical protein [Bacteroidota bacterium]